MCLPSAEVCLNLLRDLPYVTSTSHQSLNLVGQIYAMT